MNTPASPVEWLGMARLERFCTNPVRPCLVRWSQEVGQCDDHQSLTIGWGRESEDGIVAEYPRGQHNPGGMQRLSTSTGTYSTVATEQLHCPWARDGCPSSERLSPAASRTETIRSRPIWATVVGEPDVGKPHVRFDEETGFGRTPLTLPTYRTQRERQAVILRGEVIELRDVKIRGLTGSTIREGNNRSPQIGQEF